MAFGVHNNASHPIAIEFGVGALKALQIEGDNPSTIVAAARLETPDELRTNNALRFQFQVDALPKLLKGVGFHGKRAVVSIPSWATLVMHMQLQAADNAPLTSQVKAQLQVQMGYEPSQVVVRAFDVAEVNRGGTLKREVICIAAGRDIVLRQAQALRQCKLEIVGAHAEHIALLRAFDRITSRESDTNLVTLYLDIGAGSTKIAIAHGRDLVFAKTINIAGQTLDEATAKKLKCDVSQARAQRILLEQLAPFPEKAVIEPGEPRADGVALMNAGMRHAVAPETGPGEPSAPRAVTEDAEMEEAEQAVATAIAEEDDRRDSAPIPSSTPSVQISTPDRVKKELEVDLSEELDTLTDEVAMCLRYHGAVFPGKRVDRALFVGGETRHRALCEHIARTLSLPARIADPLAHLSRQDNTPTRCVDLTQAQPGWAVAYGLGLCPQDL